MERRSLLAAALATFIAGGTLAACSKDDSGGPVTITVVEYQQARADAVKKLIPEFEAEMKKQGKAVTVNLVADILTDEQFKTKITQQLHAGTAPDLIDMGASFVTPLAGAGYLKPLDEYLDHWDAWKDYFPAVKKASQQQDGSTYSLPHESSVLSLFYRKDVLQKLGIDTSQPATWDDLIARLVEIKSKTGQPPIVVPAGKSWGDGTWGQGFLPILGGVDQSFYDAAKGTWNLDSPGFAKTFELYAELQSKGLLPAQDLLNPNPWEPTKYKKFPAGTLPVAAQGTWGWKFDWGKNGSAPIPDVQNKVATWDYPALDGGKPYSFLSVGFGYSIAAKSKHPDEAAQLAMWLSSGTAVAQQLVAVGASAPRSGLSGTAPYSGEPTLLDAEKRIATSTYVGTGDGADKIGQAVGTATEAILTGKTDGAGAAKSFKHDAAELLSPSLVGS